MGGVDSGTVGDRCLKNGLMLLLVPPSTNMLIKVEAASLMAHAGHSSTQEAVTGLCCQGQPEPWDEAVSLK